MTDVSRITYGGKGPLVLGVTWVEMGLALILIVLRAKTASVCPPGQLSSGIFGLRWDFVWVIMAFVGGINLDYFSCYTNDDGADHDRRSLWRLKAP